MLNLYSGRADLDREKWMYHKISEQGRGRRVIVLVPDQFTLEAERKAFQELMVRGLMNVEIMSFSRLGTRVFQETGGGKMTFIDDLGKHMLLRKIAIESRDRLNVYAPLCEKRAFIEMITSLIGEMKQFNVTPDQLREVLEEHKAQEDEGFMLLKKLQDVTVLFEGYEEALKDKYIDTEDYLSILAEKAGEAAFLKDAVVWVDGFDFYTKKTYTIMQEILQCAAEVNITFTADGAGKNGDGGEITGHCKDVSGSADADLFTIAQKAMKNFQRLAQGLGIQVTREEIPDTYKRNICDEIAHVERNLYAYPCGVYLEAPEALHISACADFYSEAETVAARIIDLVQTKNYRFRDIGVVCNDIESRGAVLKRVFDKAGIVCFMDEKRGVMHNPFVQFVLSIWEVVRWGYRHEDVFRLLRTGLLDLSVDECEILENYVLKYGIRGSTWKQDFYKWESKGRVWRAENREERFQIGTQIDMFAPPELTGVSAMPPELTGVSAMPPELMALNDMRRRVMAVLIAFEEAIQPCRTGGELTRSFYGFLSGAAGLDDQIERSVESLKTKGAYDSALETAQIWNMTISILQQLLELTEDVELDQDLYFEMLSAGFETIEIGVIPTTVDQVLVGNLQRTKTGSMKALFAMGVNDGILPAGSAEEGIFHEQEKHKIAEMGVELCKDDEMRREEEKLAIYKMFSRPADYLHVSYTAKDGEDGEMKPSMLVDRIKKLFPKIAEEKGLFTGGAEESGYEFKSRVNYMLTHEGWRETLEALQSGAAFENDKKQLEPSAFDLVYPSTLVMSPTSLEGFSRCPFSYFMKYGIKADERRVFEVAAPEIGTIFHQTLMRYSEAVTAGNAWREITENECGKLVEDILTDTVKEFRSGVLFESEIGKYRIGRIQKVCQKTAWMVTEHINRGQFEEFHFETGFGRDQYLPPIEIETEQGRHVFVEGRIDRVDVLKDGEEQFVKIVDYKSGSDKVVKKEILSGYKLQLMLYMNAVIKGLSAVRPDVQIKPAGVFYFKIQEPMTNADSKEGLDEEKLRAYLEKEMSKAFKMDGIVVNDMKVVEGLDDEFMGFSEIIRVRKNKDGSVKGTGDFAALLPGEFEELRRHVEDMTAQLCQSFAAGRVDVAPKRGDGESNACTFCQYRGICMFDRSCRGFDFVR